MNQKAFYPLVLDLQKLPCLLVGGGQVAFEKLQRLIDFGADVSVVSQRFSNEFRSFALKHQVNLFEDSYHEKYLKNSRIVIAAIGSQKVNEQILRDAKKQNILVNVVDDPAFCEFIFPAVYRDQEVQVAVSTGGSAPLLSIKIRDLLKGLLNKKLGDFVHHLKIIRPAILKLSEKKKQKFWKKISQISLSNNQEDWNQLSNDWLHDLQNICANENSEALVDSDNFSENSKVILVGAGPGDPDLMSLKALKAIRSADVILYDALIHPVLLEYAPKNCEKIFVGKRAGKHSADQQKINELMVQKANEHQRVIRLKGGDPFVFGRGKEECLYLQNQGISVEVIPGISSGISVPELAGIPLTHRDLAKSVAFVTGCETKGKERSVKDWQNLAQGADTLVIFMGLKKVGSIAKKLMEGGRTPDEPIAVISKGATIDEKIIIANLQTVENRVLEEQIQAPALIVIGKVVSLRAGEP